jgi:hypothetical protein
MNSLFAFFSEIVLIGATSSTIFLSPFSDNQELKPKETDLGITPSLLAISL